VEVIVTRTVPDHHRGFDFDAVGRESALDLMQRLVTLYRAGSTDLAPAQMLEPIVSYLDPQLWQREMAEIFHKMPVPVGLSAELSRPGDYKAVHVAGRAVLLTRGRDGGLNAMMNVCRHRGMQLVPEGCGSARRFTCLYHAWSYGLDGRLLGVQAEHTFGAVDRDNFSLVRLECGERAGIMFVGLTPGLDFDLDEWLGDLLPELELLGLAGTVPFSTRYLDGPNWKVTADGYLESYHFASLHPNSVAQTDLSNLAAFDAYGPHMRNTFALKPLAVAAELPQEMWAPVECLGVTYWIFPGLAIAGGWRDHIAVSIMLPGEDWGSSITEQTLLVRHAPRDDTERALAQASSDFFHDAVRDEDYVAQLQVQRALPSVAGECQIFGRNEPGVQHFHRTLATLLEGTP
jgi:phenylpropionate dioxygenase-like ring-hydroxylating dioxygenase large terminal subunit